MKVSAVLKNLLFSVFIFVVFLFLLEGVFRFFRKEDALRLSMGRVDAKYHHTFEPNSDLHIFSSIPGEFDGMVHVNNYGFRGPDMSEQKKPGTKRKRIGLMCTPK